MLRRVFLVTSGLTLALGSRRVMSQPPSIPALEKLCVELEAESRGRLGVYLFDGESGKEFLYRANERFPLCSTFKWLAAAAVLGQIDAGRDSLDRLIRFQPKDVLDYSPVTQPHAGGPGLSLGRLCEAAIADSDNTAANLLLDALGGPSGVNVFLRQHGDVTTRLDRNEPALNEARPGDVRDTTTPAAMGADLRRFVLGNGLSIASRRLLTDWMLATRTSGKRLRAGLEAGWRLADKTGTGRNGTTNDVGVYWSPDDKPIVLCVYLTMAAAPPSVLESVIARLGQYARAHAVTLHS